MNSTDNIYGFLVIQKVKVFLKISLLKNLVPEISRHDMKKNYVY